MRRSEVLLAALLCAMLARGMDFASLKPQGYITDYAGVIPPAAREALERYCHKIEERTGAQIAVLVVPSLQGEPIEDVAVDVFQRWGVGKKGEDNGVLLLLATQDRRMRLEVGYGLEPVIPDGYAGSVLRAMRPALREGDYAAAISEALRSLGSRIAEAKGVKIDEELPKKRAKPQDARAELPLVILLFGFLVLMWLMAAVGRGARYGGGRYSSGHPAAWLLLGSLLGRGMSLPRGGGGFGGYAGGGFGGFGGFGGGRSGGGGASASW